ncbi:putative bifunctional diguanylate cyclase/phosphodiesterase [Halomonas beimenensis]|nr:bifunctional diguanylate cyclase/phosphodiesterase [Halomonas beimenensis]
MSASRDKGRLLLLVASAANRRLLTEAFDGDYEWLAPSADTLRPRSFDLVIADPRGLARHREALRRIREQEAPTLLPVLLLIGRVEMRSSLADFRDLVDEFAVLPADRVELTTRLHLWMRARRLSLRQRDHLAHLVHHDRLTGLPVHPLLLDRLRQALAYSEQPGERVFLQVVEVPAVTLVNALGQQGRDLAVCRLSERLSRRIDERATLARIGDTQWGLLHPPGESLEDVLDLSRALCQAMLEPLDIGGERVHVSPRVGIAAAPDDARDAEALLDRALQALCTAKADSPAFFSARTRREATDFLRIEASLRHALSHGGLELWLQPKLRLGDGRVEAAEALIRLRRPDGSLLPPGAFIAVAETSGLIRALTHWVIQEACRRLATWRQAGKGMARLAINVSAHDLEEEGFAAFLLDALQRQGLPSSALELELTETTLFAMTDRSLAALGRLREAGMRIAMDDFGTGYSTLSYLHRLPIDVLKIDRAFVEEVHLHPVRAGIIRAILSLAESLRLDTVAEGIESEAEAAFLAELGVEVGQGYLYARPMPEAELMAWLDTPRPRSAGGTGAS